MFELSDNSELCTHITQFKYSENFENSENFEYSGTELSDYLEHSPYSEFSENRGSQVSHHLKF